MNDIIFEAIKLAVMILVAILCRYAIPWLKTTVSAERVEMLAEIAKTAVRATQQLHAASTGEERKKYAVEYVESLCQQNGIAITEEQIDALIESAVKTMKMETANE